MPLLLACLLACLLETAPVCVSDLSARQTFHLVFPFLLCVCSTHLRAACATWQEQYRRAAVRRIASMRARGHAGSVLLAKVLAAWKSVLALRRREKALHLRATGHRYLSLERRAFNGKHVLLPYLLLI